jgi:hypothetical protein
MCRLAAPHAKAAAVAVIDNRNPLLIRGKMTLVILAHIANATDSANEIATASATPWTFFIGSRRH